MRLEDEIKRELALRSDVHAVKSALIKRGYTEEDIDNALSAVIHGADKTHAENNAQFSTKELLDRIGYGFSSLQFVNILFMLSGAPLFLIGFANGLKAALTYLFSGFLNAYAKLCYIGKSVISTSGIVYGFSFLAMAYAVVMHLPVLFVFAFIIGTIGIIAHGDIYTSFYNTLLKSEKRSYFLRFISYFGILITAGALFLAGLLMQLIPINGYLVTLQLSSIGLIDWSFKVYGYLLAFEITAILFIISGYVLSRVEEKVPPLQDDTSVFVALKNYIVESQANTRIFRKNNKVFLLMLATVITTIVLVLGNAYYGIYIYREYQTTFLRGFLNVALIFTLAILASLSGSMLTKRFAKDLGEAPMLVFGTILIALLPITLYFNHNIFAVMIAVVLSIVGGTIVGVAQGLMAERLLSEEELEQYFSSIGFVSIIPILLIVTVGAWAAQLFSLEILFLILGIILIVIVMPIYFAIVMIVDKEYKERHASKK